MASTKDIVNISLLLAQTAERLPDKAAVAWSTSPGQYRHWTFRQLNEEADRLAHGLTAAGITRGVRTILMVTPSPQFFALTFALFRVGAVPVVVDPGMGIGRMLRCLEEGEPEAFIGIPKAHVLRVLRPGYFRGVRVWVTVGRRWFWGGHTLAGLRRDPHTPFDPVPTRAEEIAAILFTTGSTGPAKGAVYTHGNFAAQIEQIQNHWDIGPDEVDLPTFPLFALFDPALGMTAVLPDMDPTKPGFVDPENIIRPVKDWGVTNMFGSPALINRVGRYGSEKGVRLPTLKRVVSAGAPVAPSVIERFTDMLEGDAQVHTPYGATEAVPVLSIASREIMAETRTETERGRGMCVGREMGASRAEIIRISDDPIAEWSDDLVLPLGEIGEITVKGPHVSREYYRRPDQTALAKIKDGSGFWHRMGDVGWKDEKGRIWFCGRKSHRVETESGPMFTIPVEAVFNNHRDVFRSALVGLGDRPRQKPVICIEVEETARKRDQSELTRELLELAGRNELTRQIKDVLYHPSFPVDIRHNSKIFREKLTVWAAEELEGSK